MEQTANKERCTVEPIEDIIGRLQENMRLYDELRAQLEPLSEDRDAADSVLKGLNLEKARERQLTSIAFAALDKLIIDKKVAEIESQVGEITSSYLLSSILYEGDRVTVRALNPNKRKIHGFLHPDGTYSGRQKTEAEGRVWRLGLDPREGGFITVLSKRGFARYQSSPLFDRENNYQPLFEVTGL